MWAPHHSGEGLAVDAELLKHLVVGDAQIVVGVGTLICALEVGDELRAQLGPGVDGPKLYSSG